MELGDYVDTAPGKLLEQAGILCSDDFSGSSPEVRIGTPEVTRKGMKEEQMPIIAQFFKRALIDKEDPTILAKEVEAFSRQYIGIEYSF
jgi:glycine hydroxymethyltransferase